MPKNAEIAGILKSQHGIVLPSIETAIETRSTAELRQAIRHLNRVWDVYVDHGARARGRLTLLAERFPEIQRIVDNYTKLYSKAEASLGWFVRQYKDGIKQGGRDRNAKNRAKSAGGY